MSSCQLKEITCTNSWEEWQPWGIISPLIHMWKHLIDVKTWYSVLFCVCVGTFNSDPFAYQFPLHHPRRKILELCHCRSGQRSVLKDFSDWNKRDTEGYSISLKDNIYLYLLLRSNTLTFLLEASTWSPLLRLGNLSPSTCLSLSFFPLLALTLTNNRGWHWFS